MKNQIKYVLVTSLLILSYYSAYTQEGTTKIHEEEMVETENDKVKITTTSISEEGYQWTDSKEAVEYFHKARIAAEKGNDQEAVKYYLKAIEADEDFVEAYDNLGRVYRKLENYKKAEKYYLKSIEIYPDGIAAHQNLGTVYRLQEDWDNAIKEYDAIVEIDPKNPEGYFGLSNIYLLTKDYDKALKNALQAAKIYEDTKSPLLGESYHLVGIIYLYKDDLENSRKYIAKARDEGYEINPKLEKALFGDQKEEKEKPMTAEDFKKQEPLVLEINQWIMEIPLDKKTEDRKKLSAFLVQWISENPYMDVELGTNIAPFQDCGECMVAFLSGWAAYAIENEKYDDAYNGSLAGTKNAIEFYKKNKKALGENKEIEKLIKIQKDGGLDDYVKGQGQNTPKAKSNSGVD